MNFLLPSFYHISPGLVKAEVIMIFSAWSLWCLCGPVDVPRDDFFFCLLVPLNAYFIAMFWRYGRNDAPEVLPGGLAPAHRAFGLEVRKASLFHRGSLRFLPDQSSAIFLLSLNTFHIAAPDSVLAELVLSGRLPLPGFSHFSCGLE